MKKALLVIGLLAVLAGVIYASTLVGEDNFEDENLDTPNPTYLRLKDSIDIIGTKSLSEKYYMDVLSQIEDAYLANPKKPLINTGLKNRLYELADREFIKKLNSTTQQTFVSASCYDKKYGIKVVEPLYKKMNRKSDDYKSNLKTMMDHIKNYKQKRSLPYSFVPNLDSDTFELTYKWSKKKRTVNVETLLNSASIIEGKGYAMINRCLKKENTPGKIRRELNNAHTAFVTHKIENYTGDDEEKKLIRTWIKQYQSVTYSSSTTVSDLRESMQAKVDEILKQQQDSINKQN